MIGKESEKLIELEVVKLFINKFNLKLKFVNWDGARVPILFNNYSAVAIYLEIVSLELYVMDIINWEWNRIPTGSYYPSDITHKEYFDIINTKIQSVKDFSDEVIKNLNYRINFISDFLPEIFSGDFRKIKNNMEPMAPIQIEEIKRLKIV